MNNVDKVYIDLLKEIMEKGVEKSTRAGDVYSLFGRQLRFNLKEGFPLLTTKKVFTKGIIHELLWFLQRPCNSHGSMNIEYLVRNGVHIWDDDAYRWFKEVIVPAYHKNEHMVVCLNDDENGTKPVYEHWIGNEEKSKDPNWADKVTKEEFIDLTLQKVTMRGKDSSLYRFGDLGPIYGKQWRMFGHNEVDQIQNIIDTLKTNPNDRRMICLAFNPDQIGDMALPPCHVMMQFYTRELSPGKYGLSCMWTQRSVDTCAGLPFNIASYALLTYMIAHLVGMVPDELIGSLGDCHIYKNHIEGVKEQITRAGSDTLPKLEIIREVESINDFKYEDFQITGYNPDPPIKYQLNVG